MEVETFLLERYMSEYENQVGINIAETCVKPFSLREYLRLVGREGYLQELMDLPLTYGYSEGLPELREAISKLYRNLGPDGVLITRGAIEANFLTFFSLVDPGDEVVSIFPAYQQLYSLPKAFGAKVKLLRLREEAGWRPNLEELRRLVSRNTKLIVVNTPHNPTGVLFRGEELREICDVANEVGAYVLSDESYYGLNLVEEKVPSMLDLCDRAVVTRSFSKSLSLTGFRLGWIATRDEGVMEELLKRRDYTAISASVLLEYLALPAIQKIDRIYERNLRILRRNFSTLKEWVESRPEVNWVHPEGGTTAFPKYSVKVSSKELAMRLMREKDVFIVPGSLLGFEGHFRVGFGGNGEELREGLARLGELLSSLDHMG